MEYNKLDNIEITEDNICIRHNRFIQCIKKLNVLYYICVSSLKDYNKRVASIIKEFEKWVKEAFFSKNNENFIIDLQDSQELSKINAAFRK